MSTLSVGTIQSNTTSPPTINNSAGTAIGTFCRAWVNFNGTGTVAIRASFNVTSITDNNTGDYTVNFTTALADANFAVVGNAKADNTTAVTTGSNPRVFVYAVPTTSSVRVWVPNLAAGLADAENISVSIFR
jgi:hypothetical protein